MQVVILFLLSVLIVKFSHNTINKLITVIDCITLLKKRTKRQIKDGINVKGSQLEIKKKDGMAMKG